jgi:hypothetical protein
MVEYSRANSSRFKEHWRCGLDGDFYMDCDPPDDRIVLIEILSLKMLEPRLLALIYTETCKLEPRYVVAVCNSMVFMRQEDGQSYPDFNIFVTRDGCDIYSESESLFDRLGLDVR